MTEEKILIATIEIPKYKRSFKAADSIMAKYYEKGIGKKLPLEYCDKVLYQSQGIREPDGINYFWKDFSRIRQQNKKMVSFLVNEKEQLVIANSTTVGKPRIININAQKIYNGFMGKHARNNMMSAIKDQFRQFAMSYPQIKVYPLIIECELWDTLIDVDFDSGSNWDVGNRVGVYNKGFEDVLKAKDLNIIIDDSVWFVTGSPGALFCPVETTEERRLVYKIYADRRPIIVNNKLYQEKLKELLK